VVLDQEQRHVQLGLDVLEQVGQLRDLLVVEAARGLVEEQEPRLRRDG
jgi:hypothetical protein